MEEQNHSVKERLEQLETFMGKYTAGGKDLCVAFSGGVDSSLILKAAVRQPQKTAARFLQLPLTVACILHVTWRSQTGWQQSLGVFTR